MKRVGIYLATIATIGIVACLGMTIAAARLFPRAIGPPKIA